MRASGGSRTGCTAGRIAAAALVLLCSGCQTAGDAAAGDVREPEPTATSAAALLGASCTGCHAAGSTAQGALPAIDRLTAKEIAAALRAFRDGTRPGTLMPRIARGYDDGQILLVSEQMGR